MGPDEPATEGMAALRAGRWQDARTAFEAALTRGETAEVLDGMADALWWLGDTHGSVSYRERAYAAFRRDGNVPGAAVAAIALCVHHKSSLGNQAAAGGWVARAERLVADAGAGLGPLLGHVWVARAYQTTDLDRAVELTERALALARELDDVELQLTALGQLGRSLVEAGKVDEGMALLDEAMAGALGGECGNLDVVVSSSCAMLNACEAAADLERAAQWCRAAVTFTRTYGCPFLYAECRMLYGGILVATGDWAQAEVELAAALRAAGGAHPALRVRTLTRLADLRLRQGRLEEADALVAEVADPALTALPAAAVRLARGEPAAAIALCDRRLDRDGDRRLDSAPALGLLVQARLATGHLDAACTAAARLADLAVDHPGGLPAAHAALAQGRVLGAQGEAARAARCCEQAIERFTEMQLPWEAADARLELASILATARPDLAVAEARAALAAFERLGAGADADACSALLRSLGIPGRTGPRGNGLLTQREQEVLELVAAGLSNPEIAARLFISRKTACHHVSSVLAKLGLRNRAEAVAHATRRADSQNGSAASRATATGPQGGASRVEG